MRCRRILRPTYPSVPIQDPCPCTMDGSLMLDPPTCGAVTAASQTAEPPIVVHASRVHITGKRLGRTTRIDPTIHCLIGSRSRKTLQTTTPTPTRIPITHETTHVSAHSIANREGGRNSKLKTQNSELKTGEVGGNSEFRIPNSEFCAPSCALNNPVAQYASLGCADSSIG